MSAPDSSSSDQSQQTYLSKRVMINGQFVTLYSVNGVTWLSSPEDIPDTMARLDNTRVTLTDEKAAEAAKDEKGEKGEKGGKGDKEKQAAAPPPKPQGSQYRMKGPKPRPILRQGGKVVEGTPIEPVSASSVNIKGAADTTLPTVKLSPMEQGLRRGKIVAPLAQRRPGKPKVTPPPSKKDASPAAKLASALKGKAPVAPPAKLAKGAKLPPPPVEKAKKGGVPVKAASVKAVPVKAAKPAPAPKKAAKPVKAAKKVVAKKPAPKKVVAKKSAAKSGAKKRSR